MTDYSEALTKLDFRISRIPVSRKLLGAPRFHLFEVAEQSSFRSTKFGSSLEMITFSIKMYLTVVSFSICPLVGVSVWIFSCEPTSIASSGTSTVWMFVKSGKTGQKCEQAAVFRRMLGGQLRLPW